MTREGHHALGAVAGLGLAILLGWDPLHAAAALVAATATAGGPLSPDVDQYGPWRVTDDVLPDEALGRGGPLQHRGVTHFWGVPAIAAAAIAVYGHGQPWQWLAWAALTGWVSHLAGDFVFGLAGGGRGPGIPLAPWWRHRGLGFLSSSGVTEAITTVLLGGAALALAWHLLTGGTA